MDNLVIQLFPQVETLKNTRTNPGWLKKKSLFDCTIGVPKGRLLGPLLFVSPIFFDWY